MRFGGLKGWEDGRKGVGWGNWVGFSRVGLGVMTWTRWGEGEKG